MQVSTQHYRLSVANSAELRWQDSVPTLFISTIDDVQFVHKDR